MDDLIVVSVVLLGGEVNCDFEVVVGEIECFGVDGVGVGVIGVDGFVGVVVVIVVVVIVVGGSLFECVVSGGVGEGDLCVVEIIGEGN